jgi:hypothetical protein
MVVPFLTTFLDKKTLFDQKLLTPHWTPVELHTPNWNAYEPMNLLVDNIYTTKKQRNQLSVFFKLLECNRTGRGLHNHMQNEGFECPLFIGGIK